MSTATANPKPHSLKSPGRPARLMEARQRQILFGLWKELSPSLNFEGTEREARIAYANQKLSKADSSSPSASQNDSIQSWSSLTREQAAKLANAMRFDLGRAEALSPYVSARALEVMARLALELYGERWHEELQERLKKRPYFHYGALDRISKAESHSLIEELLDHVERKLNPGESTMEDRKARKEDLRKRFAKL